MAKCTRLVLALVSSMIASSAYATEVCTLHPVYNSGYSLRLICTDPAAEKIELPAMPPQGFENSEQRVRYQVSVIRIMEQNGYELRSEKNPDMTFVKK